MKKVLAAVLVTIVGLVMVVALIPGEKRSTLTHQGKFKEVHQLEKQLEESFERENPGWRVDVDINYKKESTDH